MRGKHVVLVFAILAVLLAMLALLVPASRPGIDIAAGVFALATWIVPPLRLALARKPRTSLAGVGMTIHVIALAALCSAIGLFLALLTIAFAAGGRWAWPAVAVIAGFWLLAMAVLLIGDAVSRRRRAE